MLRLLVAAVLLSASIVFADDLTVLTPETAGGPPREMLSRWLKRQAYEALDRRTAAYEQVKTPEQAAAWQDRIRQFFLQQLGELPPRTPLNARVVGTLTGDNYRIEKIIFESQPRHYVTALLYLPTTPPPYPAVLMPSGHSASGKLENYVNGVFLAKSGFAALCYDPIGQGERYQILDASGKPRFEATVEHTLIGASCILLGRSTATYRIWDGMRALDYLASRPEIDPAKIGVSGCSGGGTLSSYLMALDPRIACAAPSCYLTSLRRLIDTIGPQDAEQNIHAQVAFGMDHADYILMRAPRPTLMLSATQDFFDIQGAWDTYRQATRWYTRLGYPQRIALVETDTKHGYPTPQREAMVRWMTRWLMGRDQEIQEPSITARPPQEMQCTPKGQVMLMDGARSVIDLNIELNAKFEPRRRRLWDSANKQEALATVRRLAGIRPLSSLPKPKVTPAGALDRPGYRIEKLILQTDPGVIIPALLFRPEKPSGRCCLYLNVDGKHADAAPAGPIEKLVQSGATVLATDLRGTGETGPSDSNRWGGDWKDIFLAYLLDKSIVGMRAEDTLICARYLSELDSPAQPRKIDLISIGATGPSALHAAALERQLFNSVKLTHSLRSWTEVIQHPAAPAQLVNVVHDALQSYDLPDLQNLIPQDKLVLEDPVDLQRLAQPQKP